jgi:penicillin-binding protein 1C
MQKFRIFFISPRAKLALVALILALVTSGFILSKPPLLEDTNFSRTVFDRNGKLLRLTLSQDEKYRLFIPLSHISPSLRDAVLLQEDQYFYSHIGMNPVSLARAFWQSYIAGGRKVGASTITMQLARLKYRINSRTIPGKLWQIARALQLEVHYSKDELLEAYLNLAPYGYNIEGAGAASFIYFRKKPSDLTLPEAITLAVIPQNPTKRRPEPKNPTKPLLLEARNILYQRWLERYPGSSNQKIFFTLPLVTYGIRDLPFSAPHLVHHLLRKHPTYKQIYATIELETQTLLEGILQKYVEDQQAIGINNASAILVDTTTMQVITSIGSANFHDPSIHGQVDGTRASRSPGSTLKPFIYALALDQGIIHPLSILGDAPTNFGSYSPDNFDKDFRGPISAHDALRFSRNIPAIKLASQLHTPTLYEFFKQAGIQKLHPKDDYGLSLVLGSAGITPYELATLYAMLANDGILRPLILELTTKDPVTEKRLLGAEASFMTLDILKDTPQPHTSASALNVYWKTGTSNGFHDAWTAGIFGRYALVVWTGNFNGASNPALVGIRSAAPLFFALVDAIHEQKPQHDILQVKADKLHLRKIDVCATTGDFSLEDCPAIATTWFIPGISPIHSHDVYRKVLVNLKTGKQACRFETDTTEYRTFEVWPSDIQNALKKAGIHKHPLPDLEEYCNTGLTNGTGKKPSITSPQRTIGYHVQMNASIDEAIPLNATSDSGAKTLHWFINQRYIGKSLPGEALLWHPKPGHFQIQVVDDNGRSDTTNIAVSLGQ